MRRSRRRGFDALVIHAGCPPMLFLDDQDYPYKVNPHFKAWVPIVDNPRCILVYCPGRGPAVLFHRARRLLAQAGELPRERLDGAGRVDRRWRIPSEGARALDRSRPRRLHRSDEAFPGAAEPASVNIPELLTQLHYDRAVKTPYELECMRRASALGARGHRAALAAFRRGASEYEAHMRYLEACAQREEEMPYNNIVAYNENAAVLHYQHLERRPPELAALVPDRRRRPIPRLCGGHHAHLCGGSGPVLPIWWRPSTRAQLRLCGEIVAGRDYREVHLSAHRLMGDVLAADRIDQAAGPGGAGGGRDRRVLPARHRSPAGPAGARRRRRDGRLEGRRAQAARGASLSAAHAHARAGRRGDGRAGHLFHRLAAQGRRAGRRAASHIDWAVVERAAALRRHPHRGQRRRRPRRRRRT